ncbi:hypothetical protein UA08_03804 [Talaromyces atroroseus]|uniref:Uncharacterized protein n=1 Tax=Talaromyces atroroseus TaxID=1441469 RepID=A0A225AIK3_TALAT|nr:hypothetical protein UA08_03804 [Talaromyces atroroseus]OKL61282.1 hypothetical protein UA08_03804 [Talaromyces atroroseus]
MCHSTAISCSWRRKFRQILGDMPPEDAQAVNIAMLLLLQHISDSVKGKIDFLLLLLGTWLSAGLALIALVGVLPVLLLYREARTDRYRAITNVHDPHNCFISPGIALLPGKRFFQKLRVPNLAEPPKITYLKIERQCRQVFKGDQDRSSTGWVNFANILRAYCISSESGGELAVHRSESFLPVHRTWILLLGIIDRYANRPDYGLFRNEGKEEEMDDFGRKPLCGLSGFMAYNPPTSHEDIQRLNGSICFRMHSTPHMNYMEEFTGIDVMPFRTLLLLYLGYIPRGDHDVYFIGLEEQTPHEQDPRVREYYGRNDHFSTDDFYRRNDSNVTSAWQIVLDKENLIAYNHERIFREMGIVPPKVYRLERVGYASGRSFDDREYYALEQDEYINRTDIYCILRSILNLGSSSQSFLYNKHARNEKALVERIFVPQDPADFSIRLKNLLHLSTQIMDHLNIGNKPVLLEAIIALTEICQKPLVPWSRELLKRCYELDLLLRQYCKANCFAMQAISILYMLDKDFRSLYVCPEEQITHKGALVLNPTTKTVEIAPPDLEISHANQELISRFLFDFGIVFPDWPGQMSTELEEVHSQANILEVRYPEAVMACLHGHVVMAMWNMVLPANDFSTFYTKLDRLVHISAQTEPRNVTNLEEILAARYYGRRDSSA